MLGSSLSQLVSLHLRHCGVRDLDGIASFTALRKLDLAENEIVDIIPLSRLDTLETLDLTGYPFLPVLFFLLKVGISF